MTIECSIHEELSSTKCFSVTIMKKCVIDKCQLNICLIQIYRKIGTYRRTRIVRTRKSLWNHSRLLLVS